ncbi:unnamed protein product [Mytilus edulis]|uniref:Uncharacterized protein n=1 Tax=Mytilus edulis TaxID=6550 RepID=A0A8S3S8Y1_MYTED|nr:unnamed protein product [Mytilus edulis]
MSAEVTSDDILHRAKDLYFPDGNSSKGCLQNMDHSFKRILEFTDLEGRSQAKEWILLQYKSGTARDLDNNFDPLDFGFNVKTIKVAEKLFVDESCKQKETSISLASEQETELGVNYSFPQSKLTLSQTINRIIHGPEEIFGMDDDKQCFKVLKLSIDDLSFYDLTSVYELVMECIDHPTIQRLQSDGRTVFLKQYPTPTGYAEDGTRFSVMKVVLESDSRLVTAYPT